MYTIDPNTSYDEIMKNIISNTPQHSYTSGFIPPTAYTNGSFSNGVHVNATFPKSVVNETFTINYSWSSDGTNIPHEDDHFSSTKIDIGNVNIINGITSGQSVYSQDVVFTYDCIDYMFEHIKYNSKNISDRSGTMVLKFTDIINSSTPKSIINIFFVDDTYFILTASDGKNGTIILTRTIGPLFIHNPPCSMDDMSADSNSRENIPLAQQSATTSLFDRPHCLHEQTWGYLYEDEKMAILDNPTTCQMINGTYVTNLPEGWHRMPKPNFDDMIKVMDILSLDRPEDLLELENISGNWTDDFISYYDNVSKQSHDFFTPYSIIPTATTQTTQDYVIVMGNANITIDDGYAFTPFAAKICMVGTDTFGNKVILQYENLDACSYVSGIGTFFIYVHTQEADNAYFRLFINDTVVDILD